MQLTPVDQIILQALRNHPKPDGMTEAEVVAAIATTQGQPVEVPYEAVVTQRLTMLAHNNCVTQHPDGHLTITETGKAALTPITGIQIAFA